MRKFSLLLILTLCSAYSMPASAGQLFPPVNAAGNECTGSTVLRWNNAEVRCEDPTPGVNMDVSCPDGQAMISIENGQPKCLSISPMVSIQSCPSGQAIQSIIDGRPVCASVSTAAAGTSGNNSTTATAAASVNITPCATGYYMAGIVNNVAQCHPVPNAAAANADCPAFDISIKDVIAVIYANNPPNQTYNGKVVYTPAGAQSFNKVSFPAATNLQEVSSTPLLMYSYKYYAKPSSGFNDVLPPGTTWVTIQAKSQCVNGISALSYEFPQGSHTCYFEFTAPKYHSSSAGPIQVTDMTTTPTCAQMQGP